MEEPASGESHLANAWERGGPNDPTVAFQALNEQLHEVKEELSPWGWRAYAVEFSDRQVAEKRLRAMAAMPGSGSEPSDGVIQGTPIWQERLDHLLLVEHLKKKIMIAHEKFNEASELFLQSHGWLVQNYHLSDLFVKFITTIPESAHDRVDYLQAQLEQTRREVINITQEFEDFKVTLERQRAEYVKKTLENQMKKNRRLLLDDITLSWTYRAQREQLLNLRSRNETLETRCLTMEMESAEQTEFLSESQRRWTDEKKALIKERDDFRKKYERMVKAHEQAMADLKRLEGTADGQKGMIMVLTQEKAMLQGQVEELEEQARIMQKQLADLRDELAQVREETRRLLTSLKETEAVMVDCRLEVERLDGENKALEARLDDVAVIEATLREEVIKWKTEHAASEERGRILRGELADERQKTADLEAYRDELLANIEHLNAELVRTVQECKDEIERMRQKFKRMMDEFRNDELVKVKDEFQKKTDVIINRNELLEKEISVGDTLGPHLATLNPVPADESRVCPLCRKVIVFEGTVRGYP